MDHKTLSEYFINEMKAENEATRKCLERIPASTYEFKPHEKSMPMGYLALLVTDIPKWVSSTIKDSVIDLATYERFELSTTEALLQRYDDNFAGAIEALSGITGEQLSKQFELRKDGRLLYSSPKLESISSTINHWVHHRGQLTVYMRLNDILVPSIYGPSADEKTF